MSLDILGSIILAPQNRDAAFAPFPSKIAGHIDFNALDEEDMKVFVEESSHPAEWHRYFSIHNATQLWLDAGEKALSALRPDNKQEDIDCYDPQRIVFTARYYPAVAQTVLGYILQEIVAFAQTQHTQLALAIVDGGVENIVSLSYYAALRHIYQSMYVPWDYLGNYLYIMQDNPPDTDA